MTLIEYFSFNTIIEFICFLIALIYLRKDKSIVWKSFIVFTFLIFCIESVGLYLKHNKISNQLAYNLLLLSYGGFMSAMFDQVLKPYSKTNKVLIGMLSIFFITYSYETLTKGLMVFHNTTYIISSLSYILCSLYYFTLLLKDEGYVRLGTSASFWWVAGTLIFYFGSTAVNLFRGKLLIKVNDHYFLTHYINIALNLLLYGCWSYAFICRKWITRSTRSYS